MCYLWLPAAASCIVPLIVSRLLTMCHVTLHSGHQWGPPPDRGAQPRHLDAPGVYPGHGGQHWCQLCRALQGQRPVPVSVSAFATGFAFSFAYCLCLCLCLLLVSPQHICLVAAKRLCLQLCCSARVFCISGRTVQLIRQAFS